MKRIIGICVFLAFAFCEKSPTKNEGIDRIEMDNLYGSWIGHEVQIEQKSTGSLLSTIQLDTTKPELVYVVSRTDSLFRFAFETPSRNCYNSGHSEISIDNDTIAKDNSVTHAVEFSNNNTLLLKWIYSNTDTIGIEVLKRNRIAFDIEICGPLDSVRTYTLPIN